MLKLITKEKGNETDIILINEINIISLYLHKQLTSDKDREVDYLLMICTVDPDYEIIAARFPNISTAIRVMLKLDEYFDTTVIIRDEKGNYLGYDRG